jgi:integrase/recombinase XerD
MTPLRAKYIRDLVIRGRSKNTQKAYTRCVCDLARYYRRSPELISYEEVTGWLHHLIKERQLAASSVNIAVSAVRFLYAVTLGRETLTVAKLEGEISPHAQDDDLLVKMPSLEEILC